MMSDLEKLLNNLLGQISDIEGERVDEILSSEK
jgi:hypothetical protein